MIVMNKTPPKTKTEKIIQILVVEDEKIIALNLKENLESLGYSVLGITSSGEKAIAKATELRPDLVLMDIRLKGNMDGIEAAQQIWERLQIPVIYLTGHSDESTLARAKITAPFGYILKPVKERELSVAISIALQRYEREQFLNAVLKGMGDGVIVVDKEHRIQYLNQVAESLTGWQFSEAKEQKLAKIFKLVDEQTQLPVHDPITAALQKDTIVYLEDEMLLISKDSTIIPIADSAAPIKDKEGKMTGAVLVFRDISERKQAEIAIRQQLEKERQLNQIQTEFIHTVSHEYRTPLAVILACSQLLENNAESLSPEKLQRNCHKIQQSVKYMVRLLEDLLTFNKVESGELKFNPAPIDLKKFCKQVVKEYKLLDNNQHKIQVNFRSKKSTACVDSQLVQQMLGNLLSNALKYSSVGSAIALVITHEDNQIIFQVQDNGIGIPLEDQPHIFDPFYRALNVGTRRGTGMGLTIAQKAVHLHGGTISFESEVGVGTTFTVTLPGGSSNHSDFII